MIERRRRRGFVMATVLWLMAVGSVIAVAFALVGRDAFNATRNRTNFERARWQALGCARRAQAAIDAALAAAPTEPDAASVWRGLYRAIDGSTLLASCDIALEAAGSRLDLNTATDESIMRLVTAVDGLARADSLTDAFGDWRDSDDVARPAGAERAWYVEHGRPAPPNAALSSARELSLVRGFEDVDRYDSLIDVEPGRVSLMTAPATVLRAIPGISAELAEQIVARRSTAPVTDLVEMIPFISPSSAEELRSRFADASRLTTGDPDAWILTARASAGYPSVSAELRWRIVRAGRRARVLEERASP